MRTEPDGEQGEVWIGPGPKLGRLAPLLAAIPACRGARELTEIADLCGPRPPAGVIVLDADALRAEDVLDIRRFLSRSDTASLILLGEDPGRSGVRTLLRSASKHAPVRWITWPPDIEDMHAIASLVGGGGSAGSVEGHARDREPSSSPGAGTRVRDAEPAGAGTAASRTSTAPARDLESMRGRLSHAASPLSAEIAEIERVLSAADARETELPAANALPRSDETHSAAALQEPRPVAHDESRLDRITAQEDSNEPPAEARSSQLSRTNAASIPNESFRAQVADLADIAQRIELSLLGLREAQEESNPSKDAASAMESVGREVARLVQFARTLGYLVSPPGPGAQRFDLTEMLEVFLTEIRGAGPDAPRCLLRSNGILLVRSDRQLLSQAFDALFFLARSAAARGEIVRVQTRRDEASLPPAARISIDFPGGRLLELTPAAILEPYGLRRILPDLGPNALSAAVRIIEGQGGRCVLEPQSRGRLEWSVTLPLAPADGEARPHEVDASKGGESSRAVRAEDPFA